VGFDGKSVLSGHFFLKPFNFLIFKFHDLLAAGADEVIVVALVRHIVVFRLRAEVPGLGKAGIAEQIERPVDGREPQMRVGLGQLVVHGLCGNVLLPKEGVQNQFALAGELELVFAQVLLQCLHFFYMSIRQEMDLQWGSLKTKLSSRSRGGHARTGN
jgi:hypothetical protein